MIMKTIFSLVAFVVSMTAIAQSVAINTDGSAADASAILDLQSTTSGFLPPRMTAAQEMILQIQWQDYRFGAVIVYLVVE
jgi:hypothetical protein